MEAAINCCLSRVTESSLLRKQKENEEDKYSQGDHENHLHMPVKNNPCSAHEDRIQRGTRKPLTVQQAPGVLQDRAFAFTTGLSHRPTGSITDIPSTIQSVEMWPGNSARSPSLLLAKGYTMESSTHHQNPSKSSVNQSGNARSFVSIPNGRSARPTRKARLVSEAGVPTL